MADKLFTPDRLESKLGKLPVWAWGVIGGTVVLGGFYLVKARKNARDPNAAANGTAADNLASVFTGMATPNQTDNATLPVSGYSGGTISSGDNALGDATLETNQTWLNRGIKIATSSGNTALGATTALQKYLGGVPVNKFEAPVINKVLNALGYPPEGSPLLVKVIQDTVTPVKKNNPDPVVKPKPDPVIVKPKPDPVVVKPTISPDGYKYDNKGREIIPYSNQSPFKIIGGKWNGYNKPILFNSLKTVYQPVTATVTTNSGR